jgi:uncharacterized protein YbcV (DUF1398 family)
MRREKFFDWDFQPYKQELIEEEGLYYNYCIDHNGVEIVVVTDNEELIVDIYNAQESAA